MAFVTVECCKYHEMCTNSSQTNINSYRYINKGAVGVGGLGRGVDNVRNKL